MITVKEEFPGSTKTQRAIELGGYEAPFLWLCLKGYVSAGNTGGFIPREDVPKLPGVPKRWERAMEALEACGKLKPDGSRGAGLVEPTDLGWMLHDYEDHGTPVEVEDVRRTKARTQKRLRREALRRAAEEAARIGQRPDIGTGQGADNPPDKSRTSPRTEPDVSAPDSPPDTPRAGAGVGPPASGRGRVPSPAQPRSEIQPASPPEDQTGLSPPAPPSDGGRASWEIRCPKDLRLTEAQASNLEMAGVPRDAQAYFTGKLVARWVEDPSKVCHRDRWPGYLATAVSGEWSDANKRREFRAARAASSEPDAPDEPTGERANDGYGDDSTWATS